MLQVLRSSRCLFGVKVQPGRGAVMLRHRCTQIAGSEVTSNRALELSVLREAIAQLKHQQEGRIAPVASQSEAPPVSLELLCI